MARVFVFMAQGFEEMELVITVDLLRRAGIHVETVSLSNNIQPVLGSRGISLVPDSHFEQIDVKLCDMVVLPGGVEGVRRLSEDERVLDFLRKALKANKKIAAICAGPTILVKAGIATGKKMTSHPAVEESMKNVVYDKNRVVIDGQIITSRSPGTTFEFAFKIIESLSGKKKAQEVNLPVLASLPQDFFGK